MNPQRSKVSRCAGPMKTLTKKSFKNDLHDICPACSARVDEVQYTYRADSFCSNVFHCSSCTMLFARPIFIPELDKRQMDGLANAELFNSKLLKKIYIDYFIKKEVRALRRAKGDGVQRLLDIGCGTGWTTRVYADHGFEVVGLEPSQVRADYARKNYGIEVVCDYIENADFDNQFDVVVLRHIIEHFADPGMVLRKIRGFLKKDGIVLVVVPNINCLGRYLFETKWAWVLPWHCNFFTPNSTRRLLQGQGFKIIESYQTPTPLYYPGAFKRTFPNRLMKWVMGRNRVLAMALCTPLAMVGKWLGKGDNLNVVARVK